jgi:glucan phosphoethanolaminetransferase (alkaline phosphatase superfamily)
MPKPGIIVELLVAGGTIAICGSSVVFGSLYGGYGLLGFYGNTVPEEFPVATKLVMTAFWWAPFLYGVLLLVLLWTRVRHPGCRWITWSVLCVAALTTAFVVYGIVRPFATTTFGV